MCESAMHAHILVGHPLCPASLLARPIRSECRRFVAKPCALAIVACAVAARPRQLAPCCDGRRHYTSSHLSSFECQHRPNLIAPTEAHIPLHSDRISHTYIHTHAHTHAHTYTHTHIRHACMHTIMHTCCHADKSAFTRVFCYALVYTKTPICSCMCACVYMHMHVYGNMGTCIGAHVCTLTFVYMRTRLHSLYVSTCM